MNINKNKLDSGLGAGGESQFPVGSYNFGGSFPKEYGYANGPESALEESVDVHYLSENRPKILLMGMGKSGKTSIRNVVFYKMAPNETLFLESTTRIVRDDIQNDFFVQFTIWDCPGQIDYLSNKFNSDDLFSNCGAVIFVIDAQDDYNNALISLKMAITKALKVDTNIRFEVFIHKVDGLSDDNKLEIQRHVHQRTTDDLADVGFANTAVSFYLTSIYDHSIFEAFSKVVQKLIPELPTLENLLNIFISNSGIEKAFLFDVLSKIYIATDSVAPVDMQTYELCCDMIDVVIDISLIYGIENDNDQSAFDQSSASVIRLQNKTVLYLREVNKYLALVCILGDDHFQKQGLIDYNFNIFRDAVKRVFEIKASAAATEDGGRMEGGGVDGRTLTPNAPLLDGPGGSDNTLVSNGGTNSLGAKTDQLTNNAAASSKSSATATTAAFSNTTGGGGGGTSLVGPNNKSNIGSHFGQPLNSSTPISAVTNHDV